MIGQIRPETKAVSADGLEARFARLFDSNFDYVYNYARARVGPADGEDVAADCFHAAAVAFRDGRADQVTRAWLLSVAHNKVVDRWRRASTRRTKLALLRPTPDEEDGFPSNLDSAPVRAAVLAALDQLSPRHRALLILHHVDGVPSKQIAEQLGLTPTAVDSALARARRRFRRLYRPPEDLA